MTSEYFDQVKKQMELMAETNRLNSRISEAVEAINQIFSEYGIEQKITKNDIKFTDSFLTNNHYTEKVDIETTLFKSLRRLSQIIFEHYYPKPKGNKFFHYTTVSALKGILKNELKLKPLIKNENYSEFKLFYQDHNLEGYTRNIDERGILMERVLMEQCFAICFASPIDLTQHKDKTLWSSFADNGGGVRIEFQIDTQHPDFRQIFYHKNLDKGKLLLNRLAKDTLEKFNRTFALAGVSKIGAFYLPGDYDIENEVRFLFKKFTDEYNFLFDDSNGYIMLPFESDFAKISITKIRAGKLCDIENIRSILVEKHYDPENLLEQDA